MPETDLDAGHSSRLLRGLIWAGVLLAPLAAVIVLLGSSSGSVRFAVLLIAVSVVLVGSAVLIRSDPVVQRGQVEDRVAEEIDALRAQLRAEFGASKPAPDPAAGGFFQDAPDDDPFPAAPPPRRPDPGFASGGRASVPPPTAPAAASAAIPRQRGAASVPIPPSSPAAPPRAAAAVRPGGTQYGTPENLDGDFGASNGYADVVSGNIYQAPPPGGGTYGSPHVSDGYDPGYDEPSGGFEAAGYGQTGYGEGYSTDYGYAGANGYGPAGEEYAYEGYVAPPPNVYGTPPAPAPTVYGSGAQANVYGSTGPRPDSSAPDDYGLAGGYDGPPDASYRAKRHRPSANDTNVGTMADFAEYDGWQPDERYVQDYR